MNFALFFLLTSLLECFRINHVNRNRFRSTFSVDERTNNYNKIDIAKSTFLNECIQRDMIAQTTSFGKLDKFLQNHEKGSTSNVPSVYYGIDLTADFIHEGTLFQLLFLRRFLSQGFNVVVVLGGGTTIVGDPSFKERRNKSNLKMDLADRNTILDKECCKYNVEDANETEIRDVVLQILSLPIEKDGNYIKPRVSFLDELEDAKGVIKSPFNLIVMNNRELYKKINLMEYLETIAKNMNVGRMLSRDCLKARISKIKDHIASIDMDLAEFLYMSLQSLDFIYLSSVLNTKIQLGGRDQMGNIVSGVELADSLGIELYGITTPLIQDVDGEKIGKTSNNRLFKITKKTTPLSLWCHFRSINDVFVESYLNWFTNVPKSKIKESMDNHVNTAKILLSDELTKQIFGDESVNLIHKYWLSNDLSALDPYFNGSDNVPLDEFLSFKNFTKCTENHTLTLNEIKEGVTFIQVLNKLRQQQFVGSFYSNRQSIRDGICRINGRIETDLHYLINSNDVKVITSGIDVFKYIIIQVGKRNIYFINVQ